MFREMRRKKQMLSHEESRAVLYQGSSGVLALSGDGGYPYAVPMSYVYDGTTLYFHSAKEGQKIDAVRRDARASFCVIAEDTVVPAEYTTYFKSVIAFGRIRIVESEAEKRAAIEKLAVKYAPDESGDGRQREIERGWPALCMLAMEVEYLTGKAAKELIR